MGAMICCWLDSLLMRPDLVFFEVNAVVRHDGNGQEAKKAIHQYKLDRYTTLHPDF